MKNIVLLGASGSIGTQVLDIIENNPAKYKLVGFSTGYNVNRTKEILYKHDVFAFYMCNQEDIESIDIDKIKFYGDDGLNQLVSLKYKGDVLVINALMGSVGLRPTIEAIKNSYNVGLANKETLVCAGTHIMELASTYGVEILPIDSEHSAIKQCIEKKDINTIKRIIITASGGSLRDIPREQLANVSVAETLAHPTWSMGKKITIDSATMMNKGLEVIEAMHLFKLPLDKINTILHKESIIHSMVEFNDNSCLVQTGSNDMRVPIQKVMSYPDVHEVIESKPFSILQLRNISLELMDFNRFPLLNLAYEVGYQGGLLPCVMNAANESAVQLYLEHKINIVELENIVINYTKNYENKLDPSIEDIIEVDKKVKDYIYKNYKEVL